MDVEIDAKPLPKIRTAHVKVRADNVGEGLSLCDPSKHADYDRRDRRPSEDEEDGAEHEAICGNGLGSVDREKAENGAEDQSHPPSGDDSPHEGEDGEVVGIDDVRMPEGEVFGADAARDLIVDEAVGDGSEN